MKRIKTFEEVWQPNVDNTTTPPGIKEDSEEKTKNDYDWSVWSDQNDRVLKALQNAHAVFEIQYGEENAKKFLDKVISNIITHQKDGTVYQKQMITRTFKNN